MEKVYSGQYFEAMNVKNLLENLRYSYSQIKLNLT